MIKRIDIIMAEKGFAKSRTAAQELIYAGSVAVNGQVVARPSEMYDDESTNLEICDSSHLTKYVGRGGLKLETAIEEFGIDLTGAVCLDVGASTGGFTDCMLQYGAARVYAVDVGKSQLSAKLRRDERVISIEELDIRKANENDIPEPVSFIAADVSFISLKLILPELIRFADRDAVCVTLIKPQFEIGKAFIGKSGVVKDPKLRERTVSDICSFAAGLGLEDVRTVRSKITGGDGNVEYLMHCIIK